MAIIARGTVVAVCLGDGGIPKREVAAIRVTPSGVEGDAQRQSFHGGPNRAVCLFSTGDYATLVRDGVKADSPGAFGENVLLDGIAFEALRAGDRLSIGDSARIEIHDVREPCGTLKKVDQRMPQLMLGRSGFVCRVVTPGEVRSGQSVTCEREPESPSD